MKRTCLLILVVLIATGLLWSQTVVDIALNGDFENWTEGLPDHWYGPRSSIGTTNVNEYTTSAYSGTTSCQLVRASTSHARFTTEPFSILADTEYTVTYYARGKGDIRNAFYRNGAYSAYSAYTILDTDDWTEIVWTFQFGTAVDDVEVIFSVVNTDEVRDHIQIDAVTITYIEPEGAVLYASPNELAGLDYMEGEGPSTAQSFELSGTNLDGTDVTITPPANFSVSVTSLPAYDGLPTMIDVQLDAGLAVGVYSGDITISGGGADPITVAVSGEVLPMAEPFAIPYFNAFRSQADVDLALIHGFTIENYAITTYLRLIAIGSYVETPLIDFTQYDALEVTFFLATYGGSLGQTVSLMVSNNGGIDYDVIATFSPTSTTYEECSAIIDLTGPYNVTEGRLKMEMTAGGGSTRFQDLSIYIATMLPVATPVFDPVGGEYYSPQTVSISTATLDASIEYSYESADGPWTPYTGDLYIDETKTVWAYAYKDGMLNSSVASATYTFPANATIPYQETFDSDLGECYVYSVSGNTRFWNWGSFGGNGYALMNGYGSTTLEEDWLILPGINTDDYDPLMMTFDTAYNFGAEEIEGDFYLKLMYSTDYLGLGSPASANWQEIPFTKPASGSYTWQSSGVINLPEVTGIIWLGFKYYYSSSYRAWQVDNINIEVAPEIPQVATPTFSPLGGTYYEPQTVTITTITDNATVYYRYDIEDPWNEYLSELYIEESTTIWAYAAKAGMLDSEIVTATYIITEPPVEPELISYWNFNNPPASGNWPQPILPYIGPGEIIYTFTEAVSFAGTILNGIEGEVSGGSFVPRPHTDLINNGEHFDIIVPTTGYEDIVLSYATQRTATGFNSQQVLYSINGIDFIEIVTFTDIPTSWAVRTVDFSEIAEVNDNPYFIIRIVLDGGTGTTGNNRFDNIRIMGFEIDEPPLPVVLSSFTANWLAGEFVELQWISETESNMLGYNVYRNIDNSLIESEKINPTVIPAYNTSNQQVYNYVDEDVIPEVTYYYWLQIVDLDLTHNFYGPVSILTGWGDDPGTPPGIEYVTRLHGAYPNPFNPGTNIRYELAEPASVTIVIYNARGQYVATLDQGLLDKGIHSLFWNGLDEKGNATTSGIYFYHFRTSSGYEKYEKMMLLK
ncbi:MAG: chitobiase/beta-hexosaminidase C-terminal domain-containing protein [Candidatus Cloacimonetes bacterium]|nr:chitobiase/beta-hexosaminidase C-terminal domain-containing protein [Candidatus Cloacimonadota bacterium]